ncbi:hypothetical protein C7T94_12570 [Pedobacter yulinensis]|uniref:DoxX family protein n=1 Tax=Pedobacter yulinensis TaxID=2126353 RepID=A0A2T3HLT7_9SPHI|nr:hypothetical protein [Pedobacter yulinensis]PST83400.1 hypothetical protein C7T94_12570 [Pedobacter yulinensis]
MKVIWVLLVVTAAAYLWLRLFRNRHDWQLAARTGLSAMLLFTALGHFMFTAGMSRMIPDPVPGKVFLVILTGILEIAAAVGLQVKKTRQLTARLLLVFFVLILPANIHAALTHLNLYTAEANGPGPEYLWIRIPEQVFYFAWVYFSAIWRPRSAPAGC